MAPSLISRIAPSNPGYKGKFQGSIPEIHGPKPDFKDRSPTSRVRVNFKDRSPKSMAPSLISRIVPPNPG